MQRRHRSKVVRNHPLEWDGFEQRVQKATLRCWIVISLIIAAPVAYIGFDPTLLPGHRWQVLALALLLIASSPLAAWRLRRFDDWRKSGDRRRRPRRSGNGAPPGQGPGAGG